MECRDPGSLPKKQMSSRELLGQRPVLAVQLGRNR